jgi:hypothetical protein
MKRLVTAILTATLLAASGFIPASATTDDSAPGIYEADASLDVPLSGIETRLQAFQALEAIPTDGLSTKQVALIDDARTDFAQTGDWYLGSCIVDERLFRADEDALSAIAKVAKAPADVADALTAVSETLVESDRLALESDYDVWVKYAALAGVDISQDLHIYGQKITQFENHLGKQQYKQAVESLHQAWKISDGAVSGIIDALKAAGIDYVVWLP